jgi:drug/metabolite transporter (DMT)-like permease
MFSFFIIFLALSNVVARVLFNVSTKQSKDKLLFFFWAFAVANILFSTTFFATQLYSQVPLETVTSKFFFLFQENWYFYILRALDFILCNIIFLYLLEHYNLSQAVLVLQFTVLTTTLSYYLLGSPLSTLSIIGAFVVTAGALVSGFKRFTYPNIFKPLTEISLGIYVLGFAKACLTTIDRSLMMTVSEKTPETIHLHNLMKEMPFSYEFPIAFTTTLEYAVGMIPTLTAVYLFYLIAIRKNSFSELFNYLTTNIRWIIFAGVMYYCYIYFFIYVFQHINNKLILTVIEKFTIPLNLLFAVIFLKETITFPQKVATVLIISGGLLAVF